MVAGAILEVLDERGNGDILVIGIRSRLVDGDGDAFAKTILSRAVCGITRLRDFLFTDD